MPENILQLRVFLSSPGDVNDERKAVLEVLERIPNRPSFREKVTFRVIAWDKPGADTPMLATMSPQEAIDAGLPRPSECDIVITIFYSRMGTPFTMHNTAYLSGTHYELLDALNCDHPPQTLIYHRNEVPNIHPDDDDAHLQYRTLKKFLKGETFFDPATGAIRRGINAYTSPAHFREIIENHIETIVLKLLDKHAKSPIPQKAPLPPVDDVSAGTSIEFKTEIWDGSPFPGLRPFTPADEDIFFGRERETDAVIKRLTEHRFVAVVGASGGGKSSLVGAGLIPRLRANAISTDKTGSKDWALVQFTPGADKHPFEAFINAIFGAFPHLRPSALTRHEQIQTFITSMMQSPKPLDYIIADALETLPAWAEILFFIDQFEELFTLAHPDTVDPFVQMVDYLTKHPRTRVVITMRADFYHRAVEHHRLAELLQDGSYPLSAPAQGALYRMITRPAERANLIFEDTLPEQLLTDTGVDAGALALLAYALDELYKIASERGDNHIRYADYEALGGVSGAIGERAEAIFLALPFADDQKTHLLGRVFKELVEVDERGTATRQRAPLGRFDEAEHALIRAFADARLLVMGEGDDKDAVEVAHEALFRSWTRLKNWIAEAQEDLILLRQVRNAAHDWEKRDHPDYLRWNHERLQLVYAMIDRQNPTLSEVEQDFIEPESARLLRELDDIRTPHRRRYDIGERLARIGDPRPHIGVLPNGIPDIKWCFVEKGGTIEIKSDGGNIKSGGGNIFGNLFGRRDKKVETETHTFYIKPFYVAKYLTTHAQYQAFVEAEDGYNNPEWWKLFPEEYRPQELLSALNGNPNAPRDSISWYQSVAFAFWLDHHYRQNGLFESVLGLNPADWKISLPPEWYWQFMAQNGDEARDYPWGAWDDYPRANTTEASISDKSTSVGMYPHGIAACGAYDVAGNLWEWCLNDYSNISVLNGYSNGQSKVLRGGSFLNGRVYSRAVSRIDLNPFNVNFNFGCRIVVLPIVSEL